MHSSDIRAKRFSTGRSGLFRVFGERFDAQEVDTVLARCADALEALERGDATTLNPDEIVVMQFTPTRFAAGYDPDEVDDYLDEIVVVLRARIDEQRGRRSDEPREPLVVDLASVDVRGRTFATRGMGAVDVASVDAFIARCADALAAHERGEAVTLTSQQVVAARFAPTLVSLGYDSAEVDLFLGDVAAVLAQYEAHRA